MKRDWAAFAAPGLVVGLFFSLSGLAGAVETGSGYATNAPTGTDITNWDTGWAQPANAVSGTSVTGWNYVGQINNGASATYLGEGWVLTAGHVGAGTFDLNGNAYDEIAGSVLTITSSNNTVDLSLFQINTTASNTGAVLDLPALTLSTSDPTAFSYRNAGSSVAMIGYGGGQGESWGVNTITQVNQSTTVDGYSYVSNDFYTVLGTVTINNRSGTNSKSITNNVQLVSGDSGGGDFIYNSVTGQWELAGINEGAGNTDPNTYVSAMVQLDTYAPQIQSDMAQLSASPEPPAWALLLTGGAVLGLWRWHRQTRQPSAAS